ncbi:MAG: helix-turn-helix domain-containing protein, partial [Trebonia sp.]
TRLLIAQGHPQRALALLRQLEDAAQDQGRVGSVIEMAAIRRACEPAGETEVPAGRRGHGAPGLIEALTAREMEVLELLAVGASNQRIAERLVVTLDTVKKHVTHVLAKLGASKRTEAVVRARELGLLG